MKYERIQVGRFIERPNRFIAYVEINGLKETVHVKNTGRCAELLKPGATVYVQKSDNLERKTQWDLIGVEKGERLINMDSQIPNTVVKEWLEEGNLFDIPVSIYPETTYGKSRFDLYVEVGERKVFIEVKGVTLEEDGVARFPDAPTERGVKHVEELTKALKDGYESYILFVIQMKGIRDGVARFPDAPTERGVKHVEELTKALKDGYESYILFVIQMKGIRYFTPNIQARFPDAPTERGVKHVEELTKALKDGYESYILFVIQMKGIRYFTPNIHTHPEFAEALKKAKKAGVKILAYDCEVKEDEIRLSSSVPVVFQMRRQSVVSSM